ncbi:MAG: fatty acid desaturase [Bermanella sp.]
MDHTNSSDQKMASNIQIAVRAEETLLRARHPILNHQNAIGMSILLFSLAGMIASGLAYYFDHIPVWACIAISTIFASISHELEHDLIHRLYFRKNALAHNFMMTIVWIMRPNVVNPWYRRQIHFNHHKVSGTKEDLEERILGNGMKFGLLRMIISLDGFLSISLRRKELNQMKMFKYLSFVLQGLPLAHFYIICLYGFFAFHGYNALAPTLGLTTTYPELLLEAMDIVNVLAVVWILPNALRAFCLHNITAALHYYGDVDSLLKQCQVMNHWTLAPINLFCCNFGSTHVIHHLVVSQPFYIRQMIAKEAHKVMRENGIRFNDFDSLLRANRFRKNKDEQDITIESAKSA